MPGAGQVQEAQPSARAARIARSSPGGRLAVGATTSRAPGFRSRSKLTCVTCQLLITSGSLELLSCDVVWVTATKVKHLPDENDFLFL